MITRTERAYRTSEDPLTMTGNHSTKRLILVRRALIVSILPTA